MSNLEPTSISAWRKSATATTAASLELPSGNVALVRAPGAQAFLAEGLIPNSLLPFIQQAISSAQKGRSAPSTEDMLDKVMEDPERIRQVFEMMDAVTVHCVIEPAVLPKPQNEADRDPEHLYVDEVDPDDKMYIMNIALGGTLDLERFRAEQRSNVDAVRAITGVATDTEPVDWTPTRQL